MISLFLLALSLDPTTETLLKEAQSAFDAGNKAEARRKLSEANASQEKDDEAIRQRLAAHMEWDECIKREAVGVTDLQDPLDTLAETVLGMCLAHETQTSVRASEVARRLDGLEGAKLKDDVEATVQRWRQIQKQTALAILARSRLSKTEATSVK